MVCSKPSQGLNIFVSYISCKIPFLSLHAKFLWGLEGKTKKVCNWCCSGKCNFCAALPPANLCRNFLKELYALLYKFSLWGFCTMHGGVMCPFPVLFLWALKIPLRGILKVHFCSEYYFLLCATITDFLVCLPHKILDSLEIYVLLISVFL